MPGLNSRYSGTGNQIVDSDGTIIGEFSKTGLTLASGGVVAIEDSEVSGATPTQTFTNTTAGDGDGDRVCQIDFKGTQSGAEVTTLARIQASHDGASDDEKGDLIFYTNDGSDTNSPTERLRLDSDGDATFSGEINTSVVANSGALEFKAGGDFTRLTIAANGIATFVDKVTANGGLETKISTADVSSPPTDAELDSAFGTPSAVGSGYIVVVDDNGAGSAFYLCASDGTNWWYQSMTKAV